MTTITLNDLLTRLGMDLETLLKTDLATILSKVNMIATVPLTDGPVVDAEAPFGRTPQGEPKMAPAHDACRAMWEAAQREHVFSIFVYNGGGIRPGAAQMYDTPKPDLLVIEDAIIALGKSAWGRNWIKDDRNAQYIGIPYVWEFTAGRPGSGIPPVDPDFPRGYSVHRVDQHNEEKGFKRAARP